MRRENFELLTRVAGEVHQHLNACREALGKRRPTVGDMFAIHHLNLADKHVAILVAALDDFKAIEAQREPYHVQDTMLE